MLPLRDADERCWWTATQPYGGLTTRSRHPERCLFLPDGTELLVTVGYVRCRAARGRGKAGTASRAPSAAS